MIAVNPFRMGGPYAFDNLSGKPVRGLSANGRRGLSGFRRQGVFS